MKINYVIASYAPIREGGKQYLNLLNNHIRQVLKFKSSIDQITIVRPYHKDNLHCEYYNIDGDLIDKVVFLDRTDNDRSFGQFLHCYKTYRNSFDYYIITEDDYYPNIDNFDSLLLDMINETDTDYLCASYGSLPNQNYVYARCPYGIIKASAFETIFNNTKGIDSLFKDLKNGSEVSTFTELFHKNNLKIDGYCDRYSAPYWFKGVIWFGEKSDHKTIFVPFQIKDLDPKSFKTFWK